MNQQGKINKLRYSLHQAVSLLNSLGYIQCPICEEWIKGEEDELCSDCERKEEEQTLLRERG